jgi:hypothetical protein
MSFVLSQRNRPPNDRRLLVRARGNSSTPVAMVLQVKLLMFAAGALARMTPEGNGPLSDPVRCLAFSPASQDLAAATDEHLVVWHLKKGTQLSVQVAPPVYSLAW